MKWHSIKHPSLFAPRCGPVVTCDHTAKTAAGESVEIISTGLTDTAAPKVLTESVRRWFFDRGFTEKERYGSCQVLFRDHQKAILGIQGVIELPLNIGGGELQELYIRFLLTKQTPEEIPRWRDLIVGLGRDFGFQITGPDDKLLPCIDFLAVLAQNVNFSQIQQDYGWNI